MTSHLVEFLHLKILKFKCGSNVYDWKIPDEWNIKDAYIKEKSGKKILDFKKNLLSVVYHSVPIKKWINKNNIRQNIKFYGNCEYSE